MKKKRKLTKQVLDNQMAEPYSPSRNKVNTIHIDHVIKMAGSIGLTFNGTVSELRKRIGSILNAQMQNWEANLS